MKRLLILGAALCSLSACATDEPMTAGNGCLIQAFCLRNVVGEDAWESSPLNLTNAPPVYIAPVYVAPVYARTPQYSFAPPPMPTRTVCTRQPWGMNCTTQ